MKRLFLLFTLFAFFVLVNLSHAETLNVGVSTNYPPIAFKNTDQIIGIEADLAQYVGQTTGMEIQLIEVPWDALETALKDNKIDVVMSGVSVTDKRKERMDFTNSYMTIGQMVLIKADNIMTLSSKMIMYSAGKRFGVELNTTGQKFAESEFSHSQVSKFDSVEEGITALKSDQIDYFIHDAPTIWQYTVFPETQDKSLFGLYESMTNEPLAWAVKKGNKNLLDRLNKALAIMQSKGAVDKVINQWIPVKIEVGK